MVLDAAPTGLLQAADDGRGTRLQLGYARGLALALFMGSVLAHGVGAELLDPDLESLWARTLVVSLMHCWYDGFIGSVARMQV
ncbi:hypothetical protein [Corallococcus coralloides]|uniref:hypothetical protein n=1 Tax=Corallococcus coralloides TaxID=184914 RepID=UPI0002FA0D6D|nr:hypothetical protein [Corallococcus coralloides]